MTARTISSPVALCLFFSVFVSQSVQQPTQKFGSRNSQNIHISHGGEPIIDIGLSPEDISDVLSDVRSRMVDEYLGDEEIRSSDALKKELLAHFVDMGNGVENGLAVQGNDKLCGATGNCLIWFFQKARKKWQLLSVAGGDQEIGQEAAAFSFHPPKHNGLYELTLTMHESAVEAPSTVWKFDGTKYEFLTNYTQCKGQIVEGDCPHPAASKTISTLGGSTGRVQANADLRYGPAKITCTPATSDSPGGNPACHVYVGLEFRPGFSTQLAVGKSFEVTGPGNVSVVCEGQGSRLTCSARIDQMAFSAPPSTN